jgi:hypothetical protein
MIINSNKRVLDYNYQLSRIFERFFDENYDNMDTKNGIYDIVVLHREGLQDNFDDVKNYINSETTIIVDITTESGNLQVFLDDLKLKTDGLPNKIYLFVDSVISEYLKNVNVNYETIQGYELVFYAFTNTASDSYIHLKKSTNYQIRNGFNSFNGSLRKQRILFLLELLKRNIDISNTSFLFYVGTPNGYCFIRNEYESMCKEMFEEHLISADDLKLLLKISLPIVIDYDVTEPTYIFNEINDSYNHPLNFVTENVTGIVDGDESEYGLITFTEKTLKPFLAHQIPMIYGLRGLNHILRELGFDLFDDLIQHNLYENIDDPHKRLLVMVDELERVLKTNLIDYRKTNSHRFVNNYLRIFELSNKGFDILNEFYKSTIL